MFKLFKKKITTGAKNDSIDKMLKELQAEVETQTQEINEQLHRIDVAKKADDNMALIKVYEDIIIGNKESHLGRTHRMRFLNLLYKENLLDKAWGVSNHYIIKYPDQYYTVQEFQAKLLKKEKKYSEAMVHQVAAIVYHNIEDGMLTESQVNKKMDILFKQSKSLDKKSEVMLLIDQQTQSGKFNYRAIRDQIGDLLK